jgi:hypothetical protein
MATSRENEAGPAPTPPEAIVVVLRLCADGDGRPAGSVQAYDRPPATFVGCLALMAELSLLLTA